MVKEISFLTWRDYCSEYATSLITTVAKMAEDGGAYIYVPPEVVREWRLKEGDKVAISLCKL